MYVAEFHSVIQENFQQLIGLLTSSTNNDIQVSLITVLSKLAEHSKFVYIY
jgi:hypothetical protein